jgi:hypothetical protein
MSVAYHPERHDPVERRLPATCALAIPAAVTT